MFASTRSVPDAKGSNYPHCEAPLLCRAPGKQSKNTQTLKCWFLSMSLTICKTQWHLTPCHLKCYSNSQNWPFLYFSHLDSLHQYGTGCKGKWVKLTLPTASYPIILKPPKYRRRTTIFSLDVIALECHSKFLLSLSERRISCCPSSAKHPAVPGRCCRAAGVHQPWPLPLKRPNTGALRNVRTHWRLNQLQNDEEKKRKVMWKLFISEPRSPFISSRTGAGYVASVCTAYWGMRKYRTAYYH